MIGQRLDVTLDSKEHWYYQGDQHCRERAVPIHATHQTTVSLLALDK